VHAWQHLQHFFSLLLGSKEFWAAVLGAVFGGLMTGWFALRAQKQAAKDQRIRDRDAERETIRGTLGAIATEVEVFKAKYLDAFQIMFKEPDPQAPPVNPAKVAPTNQSLFSVFDSNAAVLGRITNPILRRKIVTTYIDLKAIVDVVNHYTERREFWARLRHQQGKNEETREAKAEVESWISNINRSVPKLDTKIIELLVDIEKYLG
jgi:hypothetical protein